MLAIMPNLSRHFHLTPADIWGLTVAERDTYLAALDQIRGEHAS